MMSVLEATAFIIGLNTFRLEELKNTPAAISIPKQDWCDTAEVRMPKQAALTQDLARIFPNAFGQMLWIFWRI